MSRRSRKRGAGSGPWLGKLVLGLIVALLLAVGGMFWSVRAYLHSESFRSMLAAQVARAARVEGRFLPFRWQGLAVDSDGFEGAGAGPVRELKVEGLHTEVALHGIRRGVWELGSSNIRRVEARLDLQDGRAASQPTQPTSGPDTAGKNPQGTGRAWLPSRVVLHDGEVQELMVQASTKAGPLDLSGMHLRLQPGANDGNFKIETRGGRLRHPVRWLPDLQLDQARMRWQDRRLFLQSASARITEDGRAEASGEWDASTGWFTVEGGVSDLPCPALLNETWARRLSGRVSSSFHINNPGGGTVARGSLVVTDGVLTALPVLDALAAYADTRRFRILNLSDARTDWRWKDGELHLSGLTLASDGLVRLEGSLRVRGRELDGDFRLGLPPGTLAAIPGAETHVFEPGGRGMLWTPVRITGTLDDPKEDLTERLIAAAGMRMFDVIPETGEKVVRFSRSVLSEAAPRAVESGARVLEEGAGIAREVGGVIDSILGGGQPENPPPKQPSGDP